MMLVVVVVVVVVVVCGGDNNGGDDGGGGGVVVVERDDGDKWGTHAGKTRALTSEFDTAGKRTTDGTLARASYVEGGEDFRHCVSVYGGNATGWSD